MSDSAEHASILSENDPLPFSFYNESGTLPCLLICEHASNYIPPSLEGLGLSPDQCRKHYAWDIGTRDVTTFLADKLDAPAIFANYSRLVVDLNRSLDHPTAFLSHGEGELIPGNAALTEHEKKARSDAIYHPFHAAVSDFLERYIKQGIYPAVISIHSFAPVYYKAKRPWEIGFLWSHDARLPMPMIDYFRQDGFCVGDNEPYDAKAMGGTTINRHADARRLANLLVEIRNDLIRDKESCLFWADKLADALAPVFSRGDVWRPYEGAVHRHCKEQERLYFETLISKAKRGEC